MKKVLLSEGLEGTSRSHPAQTRIVGWVSVSTSICTFTRPSPSSDEALYSLSSDKDELEELLELVGAFRGLSTILATTRSRDPASLDWQTDDIDITTVNIVTLGFTVANI